MKLGFIDTHCHLTDKDIINNLPGIFQNMEGAGVTHAIVAGSDLESSRLAVELANKYSCLVATVGVHPHDASSINSKVIEELYKLSKDSKVVGYGEIGLDYHYNFSPRDIQREAFKLQIEIAKDRNLPLVIHEREAFDDTWNILIETNGLDVGGHWHCITTETHDAKKVAEHFYIGITGMITFNKAQNIRDIASAVPIDRILLETDAPYLAPIPYRGKLNEPSYIPIVASKLAEIKGISAKDVENITVNNSFSAYPLLKSILEGNK